MVKEEQMSKLTLGVVTIATNIYIDYWEAMVLSLESKFDENETCVVHVFTDQTEKARKIKRTLKKIRVEIYEIPPYGWPDATIRRYEIFTKFAEAIKEDVIMHLDADMIIVEDIFQDITELVQEKGICLVAHPGFWNNSPTLLNQVRFFLKNERAGQGSWEYRRNSTAFVQKELRKVYVCGGIWAGKRENFFKLTSELHLAVEADSKNSVMAIWHDESHLNKWASENEFHLLPPSFCFVNEYEHLSSLHPKVIAVTKKEKTR